MKIEIMGVRFDNVTMAEALEEALRLMERPGQARLLSSPVRPMWQQRNSPGPPALN